MIGRWNFLLWSRGTERRRRRSGERSRDMWRAGIRWREWWGRGFDGGRCGAWRRGGWCRSRWNRWYWILGWVFSLLGILEIFRRCNLILFFRKDKEHHHYYVKINWLLHVNNWNHSTHEVAYSNSMSSDWRDNPISLLSLVLHCFEPELCLAGDEWVLESHIHCWQCVEHL